MERALVVGVSLVLVFALGCAPGLGATERNQSSFEDTSEFDAAIFYVEVYENGSVHWTAQYQSVLENDSQVRAFESFAERFEREETELYESFKQQAVANRVQQAANVTGREMEARSFSRRAAVEDQAEEGQNATLGVVEMSFVWTNATVQENGRIVLGDVFEGGLYLDERQSLVVMAGDNLRFASISPMESAVMSNSTLNDSESVTWTGEMQFADRRPRATFVQTNDQSVFPSGLSWLMMVGLLVALLGVGAALLWRQVGNDSRAGPEPDRANPTGESAISDEELLSDEARVEQLLAENGNRMKQVDIVEATGWSKAKVSTLLSDMAEQGKISKLRIGRENIITLEREESVVDSSTDEGSP